MSEAAQTALVFAGGGALGAYEVGVWRALDEIGVRANMVFGSSIGAINAALYAQDGYEFASKLWRDLTVDQVMANGINLDFSAERIIRQRSELMPFLAKYAHCRGADISPLVALLESRIDEDRVRASGMTYGLAAVRFPSLALAEFMLDDIPKGMLIKYILASCACFPAFPMYRVGQETYLDGGYADNLPLEMAVKCGAERLIAIDTQNFGRIAHPNYVRMPHVTYITPITKLGGMLLFEPESLRRHISMGYTDALKAFGKLRGFRYTFTLDGLDSLGAKALRFSALLSRAQVLGARRKNEKAPLFDIIERDCGHRTLDALDYLLRGAEICASLLEIPPESTTFDALRARIRALIPFESADAPNGPRGDSKIAIAALERRLRAGEAIPWRVATAMPRELVAACFMVASE